MILNSDLGGVYLLLFLCDDCIILMHEVVIALLVLRYPSQHVRENWAAVTGSDEMWW